VIKLESSPSFNGTDDFGNVATLPRVACDDTGIELVKKYR
jgi:hypothetical protein